MTTIQSLVTKITQEVIVPFIGLLFLIATAVFFWGVIQYLMGNKGDERALASGKNIMVWGIIGMFIMASAWGIVGLLCNFFGTCGSYAP